MPSSIRWQKGMQKWADIPKSQREFQIRLMEIFAGFLEHTDVQYGKIVDEIERQGMLDNTLIFYILSDNGPSAEGMNGTISELLAQNAMPSTIEQQLDVLNKDYGGMDALGGPTARHHVSPWLGLCRRQHHFRAPNWWPRIWAEPGRRWSSPGPKKSNMTGKSVPSSIMSMISPPRSTIFWISHRPR